MYALPEDTSEIVCQAASESAQHHQTFDLTLAGVIMEHAPPDSNYYLFARPERGRTELHALHEDLYETYPEAQNYLLKPFQPHVTIGIFEEQTQCERTLEIAGRDRWDVRGRVKSLTVIRYTVGVGDEMLAEYELGAKSPSC